MADQFRKTDVASHVVMIPGFTAQLYVNEKGQTGHVVGPYDELICCFCWKPTKSTSIGKHQTFGDPKCCPKMRDGSCDPTVFKPLQARGTVVYPHAASRLTTEQKERNDETVNDMKTYGRNFRNQRLVQLPFSIIISHIDKCNLTPCVL